MLLEAGLVFLLRWSLDDSSDAVIAGAVQGFAAVLVVPNDKVRLWAQILCTLNKLLLNKRSFSVSTLNIVKPWPKGLTNWCKSTKVFDLHSTCDSFGHLCWLAMTCTEFGWAQIRIQEDTSFYRLTTQCRSTQVDRKSTVHAWNLRLFATSMNLRADLQISLVTHRKSNCASSGFANLHQLASQFGQGFSKCEATVCILWLGFNVKWWWSATLGCCIPRLLFCLSDPISVRSSLRSFVFVTVVWSSRLYSLALMKRKQGEREIRGNMKMRKRRECQLILRCLNKMWWRYGVMEKVYYFYQLLYLDTCKEG